MSNNMKGKDITEQFLNELEAKALGIEDELLILIDTNEQSKYLSDLLDVLNVSKVAFAEGYNSLSPAKEAEFLTVVTEIMPSEKQIESLIQETRNLYYLSISNLLNRPETITQQTQAEQTIESFINLLKKHLSSVDMNKNQKKITNSENKIEKIIGIGNKFDDYKQTDEVEDITFFGEMLEETDFSDRDKLNFICQTLEENVSFYRRNRKELKESPEILFTEEMESVESKEAEEDYKAETIDELLTMLLSDETQKDYNNFQM